MERVQNDICRFTLLYVEDDAGTREMVGKMLYLRYPNIRLLFAENGSEGAKMSKAYHPDIMMIDVRMPVLDGVGFTDAILGRDAQTRVLVVSASSEKATINKCLEMGVRAYIPKPLCIGSLCREIDKITEEIFLERVAVAKGSKSSGASGSRPSFETAYKK